MNLKTTTVDGKLVDVLSEEEYSSKWNIYSENPSMYQTTALEVTKDGNTYVLPFRNKTDDRPGIYNEVDGQIYFIKYPDSKNDDSYNRDNLQIVDYSNVTDVKDFLTKNSQIRDMENTVLSDIDSVYTPVISEQDSPEMKAFKMAIASKHCDLNKYAPRFGDNYLNDKRILKGSNITMNKLISMSKKMDIEVEMILRNSGDDIANPMDKEIKVILTGGDES